MRVICCCCGKQALDHTHGQILADDLYRTTLIGARAGFRPEECFCGHCAEDMDENGLFPEEQASAYSTCN